MQPSPAMLNLIEQIYHTFRRYTVPKKFVVCCEYCLNKQQQQALQQTSLRAIPYSLLNDWNSSPGPDPQNSDEVRYFLPRLLEFVAHGQFDCVCEDFSLRRINLADKTQWRADERAILERYARQFMADWVSGEEVVELQRMLKMFYHADIAPSRLLDEVLAVPGYWSAASLACLLYKYREGYIRDDEDESGQGLAEEISLWMKNHRALLTERAKSAIENPLRQPEIPTGYQVWEDDWMIDACLCAMSDL